MTAGTLWKPLSTKLTSSQQTALQWIALLLMTADHYALIFHDTNHWMHAIGRVVFPVFAYLLAYNYLFRTSDPKRYLLRLLGWALVSQPVFTWAFERNWYELNILFTLFFGLLLVTLLNNAQKLFGQKQLMAITLCLASMMIFLIAGYLVSYFWFGLLVILACAIYLSSPIMPSLLLLGYCIYALNAFTESEVLGYCGLLFFPTLLLSSCFSNWEIRRNSGWRFYAFYPGHLHILGMLSRF